MFEKILQTDKVTNMKLRTRYSNVTMSDLIYLLGGKLEAIENNRLHR